MFERIFQLSLSLEGLQVKKTYQKKIKVSHQALENFFEQLPVQKP